MKTWYVRLTTLIVAIIALFNATEESSAMWWLNDTICVGGPPWFDAIHLEVFGDVIQTQDGICGDECPKWGHWRNVDLRIRVDALTADSLVWIQDLSFKALKSGSTSQWIQVHDTFRVESRKIDQEIYPSIIIRDLDANPDVFYHPRWAWYWNGVPDTAWSSWGRYDVVNDNFANLRLFSFHLEDVVSLSAGRCPLQDILPLRASDNLYVGKSLE